MITRETRCHSSRIATASITEAAWWRVAAYHSTRGAGCLSTYEKISNYVRVLSWYARGIDPGATHKNYPVRETSPDESVFRYHDAATSRSGLSAVTGKLRLERVAIVGLGGTGSYLLPQIAKKACRG